MFSINKISCEFNEFSCPGFNKVAWYWSGAFFNLISDLKKSFLSQITFKFLFNSIIPNAETPWCAKCVIFFYLGAPF